MVGCDTADKSMEMTHAQMVRKAAHWLKNSLGCRVVFMEPASRGVERGEQPDVIGWGTRNVCVVIEVKRSRSDFFRDLKKQFREPGVEALGHWRFYFTPPALLNGCDLPEGWGWYVLRSNRVYHRGGREFGIGRWPFKSNQKSEISILVAKHWQKDNGYEVRQVE